MSERVRKIFEYHESSKHTLEKYAPGPDNLDWATEPDLYRHFNNTKIIDLPLAKEADRSKVQFGSLYEEKLSPLKVDLESISRLLELSFGLTATKEFRANRWSLRANPSSGNLHPTEVYLITAGVDNLPGGIYHYKSKEHQLFKRMEPCNLFLKAVASANYIGLSSLAFREKWKYGERAFRYCMLDLGHALGSLRYACALLGWSASLLYDIEDEKISTILGLNRETDFPKSNEKELPVALIKLNTDYPENKVKDDDINELSESCLASSWSGRSSAISKQDEMIWENVDKLFTLTDPKESKTEIWLPPKRLIFHKSESDLLAETVIKKRRSAQIFDSRYTMKDETFYRILECSIPSERRVPFDIHKVKPKIDLIVFVHSVENLSNGVYYLSRGGIPLDDIKLSIRSDFKWDKVKSTKLDLYLLHKANAREFAQVFACHQPIAGHSAFFIAMLSNFKESINDNPSGYRLLFAEAGLIGQQLYLEAELADVRGTGIGCFFDDMLHDLFRIEDKKFQILYGFTIGKPQQDSRVKNLNPYADLKDR